MTKNVLPLILYLTKVGDKIYSGIDGKLSDIEEFGINEDIIKDLSNEIEIYINKRK